MLSNNILSPHQHRATILDLSIRWGRIHLQHPTPEEGTKSLEQKMSQIQDGSISEQFFLFKEQVEEALQELDSELTLDLDPVDAEALNYGIISPDENYEEESEFNVYEHVLRYLQTLDAVVYLNYATHHCPHLKDAAQLRELASDLLDRVVMEPLPVHRLIPLNVLRQSRLAGIPSSHQYLFPWYSQWSTMPEDTLTRLAEFRAGQPVTNVPQEELNLLWLEMTPDEPLRDQIDELATTIRYLPAAMRQAYALRWLNEAEKSASAKAMPEAAVQAGMKGSALRATVQSILAGANPLEWRFQVAFCGMRLMEGLSRDQQLAALKPIELILKEQGGVHWQGPCGTLLQNWLAQEREDTGQNDALLADQLFGEWVKSLERAAAQPFVPLFSEETIYWLLLRTEDPKPLARAIDMLDRTFSWKTIRSFAQDLLTAARTEKTIPAGFLHLVSWLAAGGTTVLKGPEKELFEQWVDQASIELPVAATSTGQNLFTALLSKLRLSLLDRLKVQASSIAAYQYLNSTSTRKHRIQLNIPQTYQSLLSFLLGAQPVTGSLAHAADTAPSSPCWAKIVRVENEAIQDLLLVRPISFDMHTPTGNGFLVTGELPRGLIPAEHAQWFCDWLFPDGSVLLPDEVTIIDERIFKVQFASTAPEGEFRLLVLVLTDQ